MCNYKTIGKPFTYPLANGILRLGAIDVPHLSCQRHKKFIRVIRIEDKEFEEMFG